MLTKEIPKMDIKEALEIAEKVKEIYPPINIIVLCRAIITLHLEGYMEEAGNVIWWMNEVYGINPFDN